MGNNHSNETKTASSTATKNVGLAHNQVTKVGVSAVLETPEMKLIKEDKGMSRSASGANLQEQRYGNQLQPIERLAKVRRLLCAWVLVWPGTVTNDNLKLI